jgi:ribosomal protein S18 acetylase RimI-like enzyme
MQGVPRNLTEAPTAFTVRCLAPVDLEAYKALRDAALTSHPTAFSSDAATQRLRKASSYASRLGLDRPDGAVFLLGAWYGDQLVGALASEREDRIKVAHVGHLSGMMIHDDWQRRGIGWALLLRSIDLARRASGLRLLTLTVTEGNEAAIRLYERAGFQRCGTLPDAVQVDGRFYGKSQMVLSLFPAQSPST